MKIKYNKGGKTGDRNIKAEKAQKKLDDLAIQRKIARDEYNKALKNRAATQNEFKGNTSDGAKSAIQKADSEVTRTWNNFKIARGHGKGGGESQEMGQYEMKVSRKDKGIRKGFKMDEKKGATELKKFEDGGKMTNTKKTYPARIEALKAQIRAEKDPEKKAAMMEELKRLRQLAKEEAAQIQSDTFKEKNARGAEQSGDKGRATRIRSTKQVQGAGEVGRDEEGALTSRAAKAGVTVKSNRGKRYNVGGKLGKPTKKDGRVDPAKLSKEEKEAFIKRNARPKK